MSVADRLNKLTTDITNAYTSIENKGGTIPSDKNTENLATAINSIEGIETATAEGESLSLTNTKAMPYSDYVVEGKSEQSGEPSPSNPSDIHSVADDVNLLNVPSIYSVTLQDNIDINLNAGTYILSAENIETQSTQNVFLVQLTKSDTTTQSIYVYFNDKKASFTIDTKVTNIKIYSSNNYNDSVGKTTTFTKLMIKKGSSLLPYSPYNQGTVTIKQRGKNCIDTSSTTISNGVTSTQNSDGSITSTGTTTGGYFNITNVTSFKLPAGTYTFSINSTRNYLTVLTMKNANNTDENKYIGIGNKSITFTTTEEKVKFFVWSYSTSGVEINETISYQLEQGTQSTDYEPYQTPHDYTFQTEPLRSLPNGVKDTIETDGIHRRVGRVVLDGTENWALSGTNTTGYYRFSSAIINNIVEKPSSNSQVVDIISNNYMKKSADNTYSLQTGICIATNGAIIIYDDNLKQYTVENFKEWLSNNPTEVLYELAEEIIEPLTQNQATTMLDIIKTGSYEGTTNIYTDEDVKPTIVVGYYKKG